jgi:hypothetical protein
VILLSDVSDAIGAALATATTANGYDSNLASVSERRGDRVENTAEDLARYYVASVDYGGDGEEVATAGIFLQAAGTGAGARLDAYIDDTRRAIREQAETIQSSTSTHRLRLGGIEEIEYDHETDDVFASATITFDLTQLYDTSDGAL